jgi:hypothetical protein
MTVLITALAALVALASAVRSTWSPCGLSMLSTITPMSERAKGYSYRSTASWFVIGATAGGATLGMVLAVLATGARSLHLSPPVLGLCALGAALIAAISDAGLAGVRVPIHRRQVNERWLDQYRPWVYGAGFGWQIGAGLATYVTTAAVYLMIALCALTTMPMAALAIGTSFGLLRGLAVLLTRHLATPSSLRAFHRRFTAVGPWVGKAVVAVETGVVVVLVAAVRSPDAVGVVAAAAVLTVMARIVSDQRGRSRSAASSAPAPSPALRPEVEFGAARVTPG